MATHGAGGKGKLFSYPREAWEGKKPAPETVTFRPRGDSTGEKKSKEGDSASKASVALPSYANGLFTRSAMKVVKEFLNQAEPYQKKDFYSTISALNTHLTKVRNGEEFDVKPTKRDINDTQLYANKYLYEDIIDNTAVFLSLCDVKQKNQFRNSFKRLYFTEHTDEDRPETPEGQKPTFLQ